MSMPTRGKHHHPTHHHQSHQSLIQSQHIIGVNINQTTSPVPHSSQSQHYNHTLLNNTSRFITHSGSDFHVPGQNFSAQPGGQVGGGGASVGVPSGRGPPLGGIQSIGQTSSGIPSGVSSSGQTQSLSGSGIPLQSAQGSSVTAVVQNSTSSEMSKQTHLHTQPSTIQQIYAPNRSNSQQNFYSSGPRPQPPRNLNHRATQSANQSQVVGMPGVTGGQPPALYPHPSITMQQSAMYVQGQVSNIHTNSHQQNVYSMNNQLPMQYSGPPQRHQTHQSQFPYQSYQTHALLTTSNLFGYTHGAQHHGFFYHQPPNAQINLSRANANSVSNSTQHVSGPLTNTQGATIVSQGTLPQQAQQSQSIHALSMPYPQNDLYSGFNGGLANAPARLKKPRDNAIKDIVNPYTGENISDQIYKDVTTNNSDESSNRESPQSPNCDAEFVVADFAARVAKLASESNVEINSSMNLQVADQNPSKELTKPINCTKYGQYDENPNKQRHASSTNLNIEMSCVTNAELYPKKKDEQITNDDSETTVSLASTTINNAFTVENVIKDCNKDLDVISDNKDTSYETEKQQFVPATESDVNKNSEVTQTDACSLEEQLVGQHTNDKSVAPDSPHTSTEQIYDESTIFENNETAIDNLDVDSQKNDNHQKSSEGKIMQKYKNKNKVKSRELNRKGAEKEGTDMDAFVNPIPVNAAVNIEIQQENIMQKEILKDGSIELTKDIKEKDNCESRTEKDTFENYTQSIEKTISNSDDIANKILTSEIELSQKIENNKDIALENTSENMSKALDVVDHITVYRTKIDDELVPPLVAQKNEENYKVSGFSTTPKEEESGTNATCTITSNKVKTVPFLKYIYSDDQWSPINRNGKKVYDREFLMNLQNDPNSKIKPSNLPDLDVVLKDNTKIRSPVDLKFKDTNFGRHDSLFPGFIKSAMSPKVPPPIKKSHLGKPKTSKPNVIHVSLSLREDVKLRETENAWKPTRLVQSSASEEQTKTDALYKKVRSVLNKLTPQKFETLVNQVRDLPIDTQERLQGVIDLVFEKAVDEPNFSVAYALMCKELSNIQVKGAESAGSSSANFRKLILTRCQVEFEKDTVEENARSKKLEEIKECKDSEKKKELQMNFEEEERRIRVKSVGNTRFIGELFKQSMLQGRVMLTCINRLLNQPDEENLECLCKLLTTVGKVLESKNTDLSNYFEQMQEIVNQKGKISSRIRFMLQDVIDLRANKWIPRRDESNPKTMDQIQREAESERLLDVQLNNAPLNTPRKDERTNERKRNRGGTGSMEEGWSQAVGRTKQVYSVETSKLKTKPPSMDDMQLGHRSMYQWSNNSVKIATNKFLLLENVAPESEKRVSTVHLSGSRSTGPKDYCRSEYKSNYDGRNSKNGSYHSASNSYNKDSSGVENSRSQSLSAMTTSKSASQTSMSSVPQLSEEFKTELNKFLKEYIIDDEKIEEAVKVFKTVFPVSRHITCVLDIINTVLEKSDNHRNKTSQLLAQLLLHKCISLMDFKTCLETIFEDAVDLFLDTPKLWQYLAQILAHPVINETLPFSELKTTIESLPSRCRINGYALELVAELLLEMIEIKGAAWTSKKWLHSGLQWTDFVENQKIIKYIIGKHKLDFLMTDHCANYNEDVDNIQNMEQIHDKLLILLKETEFDAMKEWIKDNVGPDRVRDPKFIRVLVTAILETSIEQCNEKWVLKLESFDKLKKLIQHYVDADASLELQCLLALQVYINKLKHPPGIILKIVTNLWENHVLSNEAFLAWEKDETEREGKSVALYSIKQFFTPLKEGEDESDDDP